MFLVVLIDIRAGRVRAPAKEKAQNLLQFQGLPREEKPIVHLLLRVIVGGGTAGWLTACILASEFQDSAGHPSVKVTLIESPDIPTLGVGEGTWPSM